MDNLAICKRIAEIEGCYCFTTPSGYIARDTYGNEYNPLTDDSLNHQLMKKYEVSAEHFYGRWCARIKIIGGHAIANDANPNLAILLCIIESKKES